MRWQFPSASMILILVYHQSLSAPLIRARGWIKTTALSVLSYFDQKPYYWHFFFSRKQSPALMSLASRFVSEAESGGWGPWTNWTHCSSTCIGGTKTRYRFCDSPPPRYGAKFCEVSSGTFRGIFTRIAESEWNRERYEGKGER